MAGPRYSTLFIQSGLWTECNDGPLAGCFRADPAGSGDTALVINDGVVSQIVTGRLAFSEAMDTGLILARGPEAHPAVPHAARFLSSYLALGHGKAGAHCAVEEQHF